MIEAVKEIGEIIIQKEKKDLMEIMVEDPNISGKYTQVVIIILEKRDNQVLFGEVDIEEYDSSKKMKYLYRSGAANGPDFSPTAKLTEPQKTFTNKILGWANRVLQRNLDLLSPEEKEFIQSLKRELETSKYLITEQIQKIREEIPRKEGIFITLKLRDGNEEYYVGDIPLFRKIFISWIQADNEKRGKQFATCSICNQKKNVILGDGVYSFFTIDKPGFITGGFREEEAWKNFPICIDCKQALEEGKKYLETNLTFNFAGLRYQLIPKFIVGKENVAQDVLDLFTDSPKLLSLKKESQDRFLGDEEEILFLLSQTQDNLTLNFLFLLKQQSAERILAFIEDVFPSRLRKIFGIKDEVDHTFQRSFTFRTIRNFFSKSDPAKRNNDLDAYFLDLVDRVFKGRPVDYNFILRFLMNKIRSNFVNDQYFGPTTIDGVMVVNFLERMELIKMEVIAMDERLFDPLFKKYGSTFETPLKRGLFLLGSLTQLLLRVQYSKRESTPPFLKNLKGLRMDERDFLGLLPRVQNKLQEYDSFDLGKQKLAREAAHYLLEAGNNWKMSTDEMNFYFAAGMNLLPEVIPFIYPEKSGEEKILVEEDV
ncbi:MAG: TIGR02556 family CRISPR-associated protein [Atribacterota bacterium]|jgi:CRISPR-associated protein Csh1|nr:TIGR02556 family CRISPR-associated protein [Atribacterota bacterium]MDI9607553.1 TIGR02556 family CRISPR-associated protein [Atribacterota bacterium]MDY0134874.1 TIGR02556 family CRISPR-associated protein [Atribacterota bacterium]HPZ39974.1 TIGR02556 family CRISPR-associated protein [Candidatus Atribacteria bacterium]HQE25052.1 TIGR02556 family CRISPR-associated protein [Candidatus Atribacteria bacterium]